MTFTTESSFVLLIDRVKTLPELLRRYVWRGESPAGVERGSVSTLMEALDDLAIKPVEEPLNAPLHRFRDQLLACWVEIRLLT